jgi:glycerol-3-phosphate cytidylyltransferase
MVNINYNDLDIFRKMFQSYKIGTTFSCFDLLHSGHCLFLEEIRKKCDIMIIGLQTDPTIDRPEKKTPLLSLEEREILVKSNKYIDYYFIYDTEESLLNALKKLNPDVRFLGTDYIDKKFTGCELNIPIVYHDRYIHHYSTTELRNRIYQIETERLKNKKNEIK